MNATTYPKVAEYRWVNDHPDTRSHKATLAETGKYTLSHATRGYESAGSACRWVEEYWAVTFLCDGATHGQWFRTEQEARDLFAKWTTD